MKIRPVSRWPEHDKLTEVEDRTRAIGEFLEWCAYEKGIQLGQHDGEYFHPFGPSQELMAEWAGIDLDSFEAEKRQMLGQLRETNER
jgi:hypothetical protein